jgi:hypothetical protein
MDEGMNNGRSENNEACPAKTARFPLGASAWLLGLRNGSQFAAMPISRRRRCLSTAAKKVWIDGDF